MKRKSLISLMLLAAVSMAACDKAETDTGAESSDGEVKEFTAFFAVPGTEINDDNEIQQKIAEITGAKCKETWLCIFRKNCASVPEERSAIPLQTEQSSAG